jgi:hypothetical protein
MSELAKPLAPLDEIARGVGSYVKLTRTGYHEEMVSTSELLKELATAISRADRSSQWENLHTARWVKEWLWQQHANHDRTEISIVELAAKTREYYEKACLHVAIIQREFEIKRKEHEIASLKRETAEITQRTELLLSKARSKENEHS